MTITDLFKHPGCSCNLKAAVEADLAGQPRQLCPQHDQREIAEREAAEQQHRMWLQRGRDEEIAELARARHEAAKAERAEADAEHAREASLSAIADPLERELTRISGAPVTTPPSATTPIGDDNALVAMITAAVGGTVTTGDN